MSNRRFWPITAASLDARVQVHRLARRTPSNTQVCHPLTQQLAKSLRGTLTCNADERRHHVSVWGSVPVRPRGGGGGVEDPPVCTLGRCKLSSFGTCSPWMARAQAQGGAVGGREVPIPC